MKQLKVDQTIRNLTCGDLEIPLVLIRLGVKGLKPDSKRLGSCTPWTCLGEGKKRGNLVCVECL